jgi:LacI family transcriptional regulator
MAALRKNQLPFYPERVIHTAFNQNSGYHDTLELLKLNRKIDGIFAVNDRKAVGAILALKAAGVRVGQEVGVVGFTNDPIATIISPSLTTVEEPAYEIGIKSCELLLKQINKKGSLPETLILQGKLIVRKSALHQERFSDRQSFYDSSPLNKV